jgi:DNA polymerase-4
MGIMKAARLAPNAILLPVDFVAYRHYSRLFKAAVAEIAPVIEDRGIDEIHIDLSALPDDSATLARRLKDAVRQATGLSCSIGVAANKLLAKIGSDLDKPDGMTLLADGDLATRIWPLPVRKINGIGPKAGAKLAALGIATIGDLAATAPQRLRQHFGPGYGAWLRDAAHGIDTRPVITDAEPKSISRETTFERDLHPRDDRLALRGIFIDLCARVADDLRRKGCLGRTIGVKLRFSDFETVTRDLTLATATADPQAIRRAAGDCLRRIPLDRKLRLLGVRVSALSPPPAMVGHTAPRQGELALNIPPGSGRLQLPD